MDTTCTFLNEPRTNPEHHIIFGRGLGRPSRFVPLGLYSPPLRPLCRGEGEQLGLKTKRFRFVFEGSDRRRDDSREDPGYCVRVPRRELTAVIRN